MVMEQTLIEDELAAQHAEHVARAQRAELIDGILAHNPTVDAAYLLGFSDRVLKNYLERLVMMDVPRGPLARWVRDGAEPAIQERENQD